MRRNSTQGCGSVLFLALASLVIVTNWCLIRTANACLASGFQEDPEYDVLPEEDIDLIEEFVPVPLFMDRPTRNVPLKRLFLLHTVTNCMPPVTYRRVPKPLASLLPLLQTIKGASVGSQEHLDATKQLDDIISKRRQEEHNFDHMKKSLFGQSFRNQTCFNTLMAIYEKICGRLSPYVSKHERDIADLCDAGVTASQMAEASVQTCLLN